MSRGPAVLAGIALTSVVLLQAQEKPLTISGTISSGFYTSFTRGGGNGDLGIAFVPAGGKCDLNGYYVSPDLVAYWIQPELNASPQASDAGFLGGNGIRTRISVLRKRAFPLTFRYSNVQFEDVYFGSLSQVSSYTRTNHNKDLGLTTELRRGNWPAVTIDWGTSSVQSESSIEGIPDYESRSRHLNLDTRYQRARWSFEGFARRQQQTSGLMVPDSQVWLNSSLRQNVVQYQVSAARHLPGDSELSADAGTQSTSSLILDSPIDLTTHHASASLRLSQRSRWKTTLRAGYSSNIASLLVSRLVEGLAVNGSVPPDSSLLIPLQNSVSYLNLNGFTSLDLSRGLGLYGSLDRTAAIAASNSNWDSRYVTVAGGVTFAKAFPWVRLSGQYGGTFGNGSLTGQSGRIEGRNYVFSAQHGKGRGVVLDASIRGNDQRVRNEQPAGEHSFAADGDIDVPLIAEVRVRVGGGRHRSKFTNAGNDYHSEGYSAQAGIDHPRFQLGGSVSSSIGTSMLPFGNLLAEFGLGSAALPQLRLAESDFRGLTLSVHANPMRRMEFSALWSRSIQHLEGVVANDFEVLDVQLTIYYRRLQVVAGMFHSSQLYSSYLATYPQTERGRYYVRISRAVKFL